MGATMFTRDDVERLEARRLVEDESDGLTLEERYDRAVSRYLAAREEVATTKEAAKEAKDELEAAITFLASLRRPR